MRKMPRLFTMIQDQRAAQCLAEYHSVAVCCSVLQCFAVCCSVMQFDADEHTRCDAMCLLCVSGV